MANWGAITSRGDVEDRRSSAPAAIGGLSLTSILLVFLFNYLTGGNTQTALQQLQNIAVEQQQQPVNTQQVNPQDNYAMFASEVLGSDNDMWKQIFSKMGKTYNPPKLVLFRQATPSACGTATSDVGPFYCPSDKTIYLDETFFDQFYQRFGVKAGDVAQAYVIAHEAGHHAQDELGILGKADSQEQNDQANANQVQQKVELQADCFTGLWVDAVKNQGIVSPTEAHEAMDEAAAVGDDTLQKETTGKVNPESWTHGSSKERVTWFDNGYNSGNLSSCDTFR